MKLRVLGASGSVAPGENATCVRLGPALLVDAGSCASELSLDEQTAITDVLLTHAHLDHVMQLPFLCENTLHRRDAALRVHGAPAALERFQTHISNVAIYPDFTRVPRERPALTLEPLPAHEPLHLHGLEITTVPLVHPGGCLAYVFEGRGGVFIWAGDTGIAPGLEAAIDRAGDRLLGVAIEVSFPDRHAALAQATGHLTPLLLRDMIARRSSPPRVLVHHLKPAFRDEIVGELSALGIASVRLLAGGDELDIPLEGPAA